MPKGILNNVYSGEFKIKVVETMRKERWSYAETSRRFEIRIRTQVKRWECIYLEEGKEARLVERRGQVCAASGMQKGSIIPTKVKSEKLLQTCWNDGSRQIGRIGNGSQMLPNSK